MVTQKMFASMKKNRSFWREKMQFVTAVDIIKYLSRSNNRDAPYVRTYIRATI